MPRRRPGGLPHSPRFDTATFALYFRLLAAPGRRRHEARVRLPRFVTLLALLAALPARAEPPQVASPPDVQEPRIVTDSPVTYPPGEEATGRQAEVVLEFTIDVQGQVRDAKVVTSASPAFDAAALEAAAHLRFSPALQAGKPVAVRIRWRYRFEPTPTRRASAPSLGRYDRKPAEVAPQGASSLEGQLIERGTGRPVVGALLVVEGTPAESVTDAQGRFRFGVLPAGRYVLLLPAAEYRTLRVGFVVHPGQTTHLLARPERLSYSVYRASAEGPPDPGTMTRRGLSADEIQKVPGVYGDALKVVQNLPGVARPSPLGGEIIVRGAAPGDTVVAVEGVPVPVLYHFGGVYSVLNTDILEGVDFLPGGFPVAWGRQIGGVLNARLRTPRQAERWSGYVEANVFHAGFLFRGPLGEDTTLTVAARRSYLDAVLNAVLPAGTLPFTVAPRYYDGQVKLDHRFSSHTDATLLAFGSSDALALVTPQPPDLYAPDAAGKIDTSTTFASLLGLVRHDHGEWSSKTTLGAVWTGQSTHVGKFLQIDADAWQLTARQDFVVGKGPLQWRTGLDLQHNPYFADVTAPTGRLAEEGPLQETGRADQTFRLHRSFAFFSPSAWFDAVYRPDPKWTIVPGLRLDLYRGDGHDQTLLPRVLVRRQLTPDVTWKTAAGLLSQRAQPYQLLPEVGTPTLTAQRSAELATGVEWQATPDDHVDLQVFGKHLWNLVVPTPGLFPATAFQNTGTGQVVGLELLARHRLSSGWFGWIAYTLQHATRRDTPDGPTRLFDWDQTHILTAVASYHLPKQWEVGARFRLVSGNPRTGLAGAVWSEKRDDWQGIDSACYNCERLPAFHQLDLRVDKRFVYDRWLLNLYLDVQNVYNRSNPEGLFYNYDLSRYSYQSGLPILPSLGIRGEF